jgi:DNA-binding GntR family transcriptional regulator
MTKRRTSVSSKKATARSERTESDRATSRSQDLLHQIEEDILLGKLPPGARLDEKLLAERFGVSRTPVREALWHLTSSGLVEMRRHHGAIVRRLSLVELVEMFQVMAEIEGLCARLSARRMTLAERQQLREIHKIGARHVAAKNYEEFFENNNEFHEAIFIGSKNGFLLGEARRLRNRVNPHRRYITFQPGSMARSIKEHETIIEAIERNDDDVAHQLMRSHVNMLGEGVADFIASLSKGALDGVDDPS